ncbi:hypothetical protein [Clostridium sp.]|uniref:hypothetical protein n=1 Tax=Clostridium sp. TaxID=1506 RepID=UPI001B502B59|nr:hypothetical protein [Clostridium sp.]MBP3917403.1 hypothetical protein [Clostridium sp.]
MIRMMKKNISLGLALIGALTFSLATSSNKAYALEDTVNLVATAEITNDTLEVTVESGGTIRFTVGNAAENTPGDSSVIKVISSIDYDVKIKSDAAELTGTGKNMPANLIQFKNSGESSFTKSLTTSNQPLTSGVQTATGNIHQIDFQLSPVMGYPIGSYTGNISVTVTQK